MTSPLYETPRVVRPKIAAQHSIVQPASDPDGLRPLERQQPAEQPSRALCIWAEARARLTTMFQLRAIPAAPDFALCKLVDSFDCCLGDSRGDAQLLRRQPVP